MPESEGYFTLIELLVVLVLAGILVMLAAVGFFALDTPPKYSYCQGYCEALDTTIYEETTGPGVCTCIGLELIQKHTREI